MQTQSPLIFQHSIFASKIAFLTCLALFYLLLLSGCARLSPDPTPGTIVFQDNFSRRDGGWPTLIDPGGISDYLGEAYRIQILEPNSERLVGPGINLVDVVVEVQASRIGGPEDNRFGLLCRYQDDQNYYAFVVSSDGYYAIYKSVTGEITLLDMPSMLPAVHLQESEDSLLLKITCQDDRLALWVNGERIAERQDSDISRGDVGLLAGAYAEAGTEILFDQFTVAIP